MQKENLMNREYVKTNYYPEPAPTPRETKDRQALLSDFNCGYISKEELREELAALKDSH